MTCEHHKTCGDCQSPSQVRQLELSARYLASTMAESTEICLAAFEAMMLVKSSPKNRMATQKSLCLKMLIVCAAEWDHVLISNTKVHRVHQIIKETEGFSVYDKFEKWLEKWAS